MKRLIKLKQPVIVEGKYDKITLCNIIDAVIIPTNGFGIFKDKEKCAVIKALAQKNGVIVITDSDSAGALIRAHIKKITGNAEIINVYVPRIGGKERRKTTPSREGILGVEGMTPEIIEKALFECGVFCEQTDSRRKITKADMFSFSLSGCKESAEKRKSFLRFINMPDNLSSSAMLDLLNGMFSYEEFKKRAVKWQENTGKD